MRSSLLIIITLLITTLLLTNSAYARYDITKVNDWRYRSYMCAYTTSYLMILNNMQKDFDLNNKEIQAQVMSAMADIGRETEQKEKYAYNLDDEDMKYLGVSAFAIRSAIIETYGAFNPESITKNAFHICIGLFEKGDVALKESVRGY